MLALRRSRAFSQHLSPPGKSQSHPQFTTDHYHSEAEGSNKYNHVRRRGKSVSDVVRSVYIPRDFRFSILSSLVVALILFKIWDEWFSKIGDIQDLTPITEYSSVTSSSSSLFDISDNNNDDDDEHSSFAVVINTFRRPKRLNDAVLHYAESCGKKYRVGQVFIVWSDQELEAPDPGFFFKIVDNSQENMNETILRKRQQLRSNRVEVEVLVKAKDSLNSRFEPIPQLRTTAVFMVDDDVRVTCSSLHLAFQAWKQHKNSMVGYYPRLVSSSTMNGSNKIGREGIESSSSSQLVYNGWPVVYWRQKFNIILTKASFIHSKYLELYTSDKYLPREIKDYVDHHKNCEDIAMSMLVANYTKQEVRTLTKATSTTTPKTTLLIATAPPIYVEGRVSDMGLFGGISSGTGHWTTRSNCVMQLSEIFLSKGWESPFEDEFDLRDRSWIAHGTWFLSQPSNIFEWFYF